MLWLSVKMEDKMKMTDLERIKIQLSVSSVLYDEVMRLSTEYHWRISCLLHKYWENMSGVTKLVTLFVSGTINIFSLIISPPQHCQPPLSAGRYETWDSEQSPSGFLLQLDTGNKGPDKLSDYVESYRDAINESVEVVTVITEINKVILLWSLRCGKIRIYFLHWKGLFA